MITDIHIHSEAYYFNCRECGDILFYEDNVGLTEKRRRLGFCEECLIVLWQIDEPVMQDADWV